MGSRYTSRQAVISGQRLTDRASLRRSLAAGAVSSRASSDVDPNVWGPALWNILFYVSFRYPNRTEELEQLFRLLEKILPCQECRRSYTTYKKQIPFDGRTTTPAAWLWTIHDMVNQKLGKICISFDRLELRYELFTTTTSDFELFDTFCIIASASTEEEAAGQFVHTVSTLLQKNNLFRLPSIVMQNDPTKSLDLFLIGQELYQSYDMPPMGRDQFESRYKMP